MGVKVKRHCPDRVLKEQEAAGVWMKLPYQSADLRPLVREWQFQVRLYFLRRMRGMDGTLTLKGRIVREPLRWGQGRRVGVVRPYSR